MGELQGAFAAWGLRRKPTLVVWGEDDGVVRFEGAEELMPLMPHAKLVTIPNGRHMIVVEFSDELSAAVLAFFDET